MKQEFSSTCSDVYCRDPLCKQSAMTAMPLALPGREFTVKQSLGLLMMHGTTFANGHRQPDNKLKQQLVKSPQQFTKEELFCYDCKIQCNSDLQYEVHVLSQKHKARVLELSQPAQQPLAILALENIKTEDQAVVDGVENGAAGATDENNNNTSVGLVDEVKPKKYIEGDYSIAHAYDIDAEKYLLPDEKRSGKYEKFGYYCSKCDAYMTGQIQLVMHVKGMKHQFVSPGELPNYQPSKQYNPFGKSVHKYRSVEYRQNRRGAVESADKPCTVSFDNSRFSGHNNHYRLGFEQKQQFQQQHHQQQQHYQRGGVNGGSYIQKSSMHNKYTYCSSLSNGGQLLDSTSKTSPSRATSFEYMKRIFDSKYAATEQQFNQLYPDRFQQQQQPQYPAFFGNMNQQQSPRTPTVMGRYAAFGATPHNQSSSVLQQQPQHDHFFNFNNAGGLYNSNGGNQQFAKPSNDPLNRMTTAGSSMYSLNGVVYPSVPSTPVHNPNGLAFFATPYQTPQQQHQPLHQLFNTPGGHSQQYIYATPVQPHHSHFAAYNSSNSNNNNNNHAEHHHHHHYQNNTSVDSIQSLDMSLSNQSFAYEPTTTPSQMASQHQMLMNTPPPPPYSAPTAHLQYSQPAAASTHKSADSSTTVLESGTTVGSESTAATNDFSSSPPQSSSQFQHMQSQMPPVMYANHGYNHPHHNAQFVYDHNQRGAVLQQQQHHDFYQSGHHQQQQSYAC